MTIARSALSVTIALTGPVLIFGLVAGLGVAIFQALTQIHEMTLTFIPKMIAVALALLLFGPWMLQKIVAFTTNLFLGLPGYVG